MMENKNDASRNLEKALQALEQAKVRERKGRLDLPIVSGKRKYSHYKSSMTASVKKSQRLPQN